MRRSSSSCSSCRVIQHTGAELPAHWRKENIWQDNNLWQQPDALSAAR